MRCTTCHYPLFDLKGRQCPECGTPFDPSRESFVPNTVRFCCPQCDQAYYGTGPDGHLEPVEFDCTTCGRHVHMSDMVLRPTEGVGESQTRVDRMPWLERREHGLVRAWLDTVIAAMTTPRSLMRAIPEDVPAWRAWRFMVVNVWLFRLTGQTIPGLAIMAVVIWGLKLPVSLPPGAGRFIAMQGILQEGTMFIAIALLPLAWIAMTHGLLLVSGGAGASLRRTSHAIYYSAAARAPSAIPCLDAVGFVWWIVSAILMIKEAHRCHGGRAAFAVLASGLVASSVYLTVATGVALAPMGLMGMLGPGGMTTVTGLPGQPIAPGQVGNLHASISRLAGDRDGWGPDHVVELIVAGEATAADFIAPATATDPRLVAVAGTPLPAIAGLPEDEQRSLAESAGQALPDGVVAHRLGDFVFTYHGQQFPGAPPSLWIVIGLPDPDQNAPPGPADLVYASLAGGSVVTFPYHQMARELAQQNRTRRAAGLPPLPDPVSVTQDQPAIEAEDW